MQIVGQNYTFSDDTVWMHRAKYGLVPIVTYKLELQLIQTASGHYEVVASSMWMREARAEPLEN